MITTILQRKNESSTQASGRGWEEVWEETRWSSDVDRQHASPSGHIDGVNAPINRVFLKVLKISKLSSDRPRQTSPDMKAFRQISSTTSTWTT